MRAVRVHTFGDPDVLRPDEVLRPEPAPGEVLIRVHAAGVNPADLYARRGFPNIPPDLRPEIRLPWTPGGDVSGVVVDTAPDVTAWRPGDRVFGLVRFGDINNGGRAYAEYTTAPADHLARVPDGLDHVPAAGVPMAGLTALQIMFEVAALPPGKKVLVNGAAGGTGHFFVQLAKTRDAHVVAVASGRHEAFLRDLGADEFIDYTTTDVATAVRDVDHLFDAVAGPDAYRLLPVLRDGGVISPIYLGDYHPEEAAARGITFAGGQVRSDGAGMAELARLIESGAVRVAVDSEFALADAASAHAHGERGHLQGKIVLRVD
ncbi:NADP-dependent oxidoreductase [Actinomadura rayongensis]|uniref:Zinc-binding dehydrogenase n=1 Tax=Actinomadura rayongensis TaxID=1429076 RepID=A0A6I4WGH9_9ACTN|nr:NADP-dependent oxidoreductase [Actinomadura rayongensis]MXQ66114.1 zinc-binding dehydrogenase [Actinomadura rayongensis]